MSQPLFRREVFDAKRGSWLGGISLAQPPSLWLLTCVAVLAALLICLLLTFGTYTRRSTVTGQLVSSQGLATLLAPATGIVHRLPSGEGQRITAGQTLLVVSMSRATPESGDTQAALEARIEDRRDGLVSMLRAQRTQLQAQADGLELQVATAHRELGQIEVEVDTRLQQARIAGETLARLKQLEDNRYVSLLQIKQQESAALDATGQVQILQRQATTTRRSIAQLEQALKELPGQQQAMQAALQRDLASLEAERLQAQAAGALAVRSPVSGVVATQLVKRGQSIEAGQPLMSLLPGDGKLEAELLVPSRSIGFIEPGDRVLLRYQAYPYQKFGHQPGRVIRISRSALNEDDLRALHIGGQQDEPLYRISVAISAQSISAYGKTEILKPGMLVDADILGEKRTLIEWLFEPLYSIKEKIVTSSARNT